MERDLNQQQTLFKFVSIRPPQLVDPQGKDRRFVEDRKVSGTVFQKAASSPGSLTKWAAMKAVNPTSFGYLKNLAAIETKVGIGYLDAAQLVARVKSSFIPEQLYEKLAPLTKTLGDAIVRDLFDNLYYQVVHQEDFYSKEAVVQLLALENILVFRAKLSKEEFLRALPTLANARVVLPAELFTDAGSEYNVGTQPPAGGQILYSKKKLIDDAAIVSGRYDLQRNEMAIEQLRKYQRNYRIKATADYDDALAAYMIAVDKAYSEATVVEKTRTDCSGCVETYYDYENLVLPAFSPRIPPEIDSKELERYLTPESMYVLEEYDLMNEKTVDAVVEGIQRISSKLALTVFGAVRETERVVSVGGMTFQARTGDPMVDSFATENDIPFTVRFKANRWNTGKIQFVLTDQYANAEIASVAYRATFPNGAPAQPPVSEAPATDFALVGGGLPGIFLFTNMPYLIVPNRIDPIHLSMSFTLVDGTKATLEIDFYQTGDDATPGIATVTNRTNDNSGDVGSTFAPKMFGIRRLGIADYKKVVSQICCYKEAEVSAIENIMQGEFKNRTTTRERIEETTITTETSSEKENITDTAITERFEMQSEIAKLVQKQKEANVYANVKGKYGESTTFEVGGNYATMTAKEESNRQAVTKSKEITQSATERIVSRFREEVVTKVTERFKEENTHILDNRTGTGNVSGVYRYINAVYKNSILNYGKRLMFEFMVPQPSKLFRAGIEIDSAVSTGNGIIKVSAPVTPESIGVVNAQSISALDYFAKAAKYGAQVEAPPAEYTSVGRSYKGEGKKGATAYEFNDIKVPEGYRADYIRYDFAMRRSENSNLNAHVIVGNTARFIPKSTDVNVGQTVGNYTYSSETISLSGAGLYSEENVPVSVVGWDLGAFALNVSVKFLRTSEAYQAWQLKTYESIIRAYKDRVAEYNDQISSLQTEGTKSLAANPLFYRDIESGILKKNCISYLVPSSQLGVQYYTAGNSFKDFSITRNVGMDAYTGKAKFMEQAFEWNIMSYTFYPYYWGFKDDWKQLFQSENDDPLFRNFMQAGMARVIVSVTPGFEDAVMHFMSTGEIWNGGEVPTIGDPLYLSIVDELKEQEYVVEETWETTLPTSLIGLQEKGVSVTTVGLPCGDGCDTGDSPFRQNDNTLKPPIEVKP